MSYVEMWLEMRGSGGPYRVAMLIPIGTELPDGFTMKPEITDYEGSHFFVSIWYDQMIQAKDAILEAAKFYSELKIQFLFFRELRQPLTD